MKITLLKSANGNLHDLSWEVVQTWVSDGVNDTPGMPSASGMALEEIVWAIHPDYYQQQDAQWIAMPDYKTGKAQGTRGFYYRVEDKNGWRCYAMLVDYKCDPAPVIKFKAEYGKEYHAVIESKLGFNLRAAKMFSRNLFSFMGQYIVIENGSKYAEYDTVLVFRSRADYNLYVQKRNADLDRAYAHITARG